MSRTLAAVFGADAAGGAAGPDAEARGRHIAPLQRRQLVRPGARPERHQVVRTHEGLLCPVCRRAPLLGRRSVCSPACRAKRHRQGREQARHARDREVRGLLEAALRRLNGEGES